MKAASRIGLAAMAVCVAMLAAAATAADQGWSLELRPYIWFVNIDGTLSVGDKEADFEADFSDLIDKVDLAGELMAIATYNRWVLFAQADYFSLSDEFENGPGGDLEADMTYLTGTAGYRFDGFVKDSTMDLLAGVRYLRSDTEIEVHGVGASDKTSEATDAIVMLRSSFPLSEKLSLGLSMSIGTGDSDLVWELQPDLAYQFSERVAGHVGYRRLEYEFEEDDAELDVGFQGFMIGVGVTL
ncbi:MAG: outer membrane beta-barrel protein [Verrucomicrobiota bacterium]